MIILLASIGLLLTGALIHPTKVGIKMTKLKSLSVLLFTLLPCSGFVVCLKYHYRSNKPNLNHHFAYNIYKNQGFINNSSEKLCQFEKPFLSREIM